VKKETQRIRTRLLQLGSLLSVLLFCIYILPPAAGEPNAAKRSRTPIPTGGILWDQYSSPATEPPVGIGSQNFESANSVLDDQAADDFMLCPIPCRSYHITTVGVMGEYSAGGGPASSFNIYFYTNAGADLPGPVVVAFTNLSYAGTPPDFLITLPYSVAMYSGVHYWVSVQARQDLNPNGQWFWHNRTVQTNAGAAWQNPGDGYGTGCVT
jgi:hypothetical protein